MAICTDSSAASRNERHIRASLILANKAVGGLRDEKYTGKNESLLHNSVSTSFDALFGHGKDLITHRKMQVLD